MKLANAWVDNWSMGATSTLTEEELDCTQETHETQEPQETHDEGEGGLDELQRVIDECALTARKTSNRKLFALVREVRGMEFRRKAKFSPETQAQIANAWIKVSGPFLTPGKDYFTDYCCKYEAVRHPKGATLAAALERAETQPPPVRALLHPNPEVHLLASLCRELQKLTPNRPFFLDGRSCAAVFGHQHHSTIASWLRALSTLRVIVVVGEYKRDRAREYQYIAPD